MVLSKKPLMTRQKVFWFTLIFSRTIFLAALVLLRDIKGASPRKDDGVRDIPSLREILFRVDPLGTVLSVPGLVLLTYGLTSGNISGSDTGAVIGTIVAAVILLVCFVFVEASKLIVPRCLWTGANLAVGCGLAALTCAVWQGTNYFLTIELQGTQTSQNSYIVDLAREVAYRL